jgi:hypothetical protein
MRVKCIITLLSLHFSALLGHHQVTNVYNYNIKDKVKNKTLARTIKKTIFVDIVEYLLHSTYRIPEVYVLLLADVN